MYKRCVICKKRVFLSSSEDEKVKERPEQCAWDDGTVFRDTVGYGSTYDGTELVICICDACITLNEEFIMQK